MQNLKIMTFSKFVRQLSLFEMGRISDEGITNMSIFLLKEINQTSSKISALGDIFKKSILFYFLHIPLNFHIMLSEFGFAP